VYRFKPEQEWFESLKKNWEQFAKVTKRVAPLAAVVGGVIGIDAASVKEVAEKAEKLTGDVKEIGGIAEELGYQMTAGLVDEDARHLLEKLIRKLDGDRGPKQPEFGGLHPYHRKEDGRVLWLCSEHRAEYERMR
jgi:hypothetical protein